MKKLCTALLAVLLLSACSGNTAASPSPSIDSQALAPADLVTTVPDMSGYTFLEDTDPAFLEIDVENAIKFFEEDATGILYFGRVSCPFCQRAVPNLNEAAKEAGITVYYVDVDLTKLTMEDYNRISPYIEETFVQGSDRESDPEFMIPDVIAIKDGEIVGYHVSLLDDYTITSEDSQMTDEQKQELQDIYTGLFEAAGLA